jgi:hypothetical protein
LSSFTILQNYYYCLPDANYSYVTYIRLIFQFQLVTFNLIYRENELSMEVELITCSL